MQRTKIPKIWRRAKSIAILAPGKSREEAGSDYDDSGSKIRLVPVEWLLGNNCALWPPNDSGSNIHLAYISKEPPGANWQSVAIKIMYRSSKDLWAVILQPHPVL